LVQLKRWLLHKYLKIRQLYLSSICATKPNHIQHDDADYVGAVKENMMGIIREKEKKKGKNWFARFFS
ncbi:hypothetical protein SLK22_17700, partial [Acinetobacter pittii]|nr:hypothetical protein [Acinetobacter pittii]